jgi:hypothetical protein
MAEWRSSIYHSELPRADAAPAVGCDIEVRPSPLSTSTRVTERDRRLAATASRDDRIIEIRERHEADHRSACDSIYSRALHFFLKFRREGRLRLDELGLIRRRTNGNRKR